MKQIEKYLLPRVTEDLLHLEAQSSIHLTKEVANKINELVDAYNHLTQTRYDKMNEQDARIREGILYMKDNLAYSLKQLMDLILKNGYVDNRIKEHIGILIERVDNLTTAMTQDNEVIDARIGASGEEYMSLGNAIRGQIKNITYSIKTVITNDNYKEKLPDVNLIDEPCTYQLNFTYGTEELPANLPYTSFKSNVDELITFKDHYYRQLIIGNSYVYTRYGVKTSNGITYYGWNCIYDKTRTEEQYSKFYKSKGIIDSFGYNVNLPDANKILENSIYQLNFNYGSTDITANLPYKKFTGRIDELITFADKYYRQLLIGDKYIYTRNGILNSTKDGVDYGEWILIWTPETNKERILIVDKSGSGDYTSLTKCVFDNLGSKNVIHVKPGTYDLITEFKEYFGEDYFTKTTLQHHGLVVQNGTKFILDSGAEVTFLYDGANSVVEEYFSPFIMKNDSGEIHGGRIICTNCRYAIHDDVYDSSQNSKSVIDGVYMHYTSTRNVGIGGGLGQSSHITVRNCIVISGSDAIGYGIFYHNAATGNSKSHIIIENNFVKDNIIIEPYGASTHISTSIVCGNKCNDVKKVMGGDIDNITLYDFNNVKEV